MFLFFAIQYFNTKTLECEWWVWVLGFPIFVLTKFYDLNQLLRKFQSPLFKNEELRLIPTGLLNSKKLCLNTALSFHNGLLFYLLWPYTHFRISLITLVQEFKHQQQCPQIPSSSSSKILFNSHLGLLFHLVDRNPAKRGRKSSFKNLLRWFLRKILNYFPKLFAQLFIQVVTQWLVKQQTQVSSEDFTTRCL